MSKMIGRPTRFHGVKDVLREMSAADVAKKFKVSRATSYRWLSKIARNDREGK